MEPIARAGYQEYFVTTQDARFFIEFSHGDRANAKRQTGDDNE
jgi:hypothetical protein